MYRIGREFLDRVLILTGSETRMIYGCLLTSISYVVPPCPGFLEQVLIEGEAVQA